MTGGIEPSKDEQTVQAIAAAAEVVREALVRLRGGAPFLSSADSLALVGWLESGVSTARILAAVETAAAQRHARRVRAPLALVHARRHLTARRGPAAPLASDGPADHPLAPIAAALRAHTAPPGLEEATARLAAHLRALPTDDRDALADQAADAVVAFLDATWVALGERGRAGYVDRATARLADVLDDVDEGLGAQLVEEHARGLWREAWPFLTLSNVLHLANP